MYFNVDADLQEAFTGIVLNFSPQEQPVCLVNRSPLDLSGFDTLSMRVRAMDVHVNAEIALQDEDHFETTPKAVLVQNGDAFLPPGEWIEKRFRICDLLASAPSGGPVTKLARSAITKLLIGFASYRFQTEGTYATGTRYLDVDDVVLLPCPGGTGCQPCP
jgi:hypothetical protein